MKHKINIAELLKGAPKGTKLWSPICGDCTLEKVGSNGRIFIELSCNGFHLIFNKYGQLKEVCVFQSDEDCIPVTLFPSKDCHTWENFKAPWKHKHFESFQRVLVYENGVWVADIYSDYNGEFHRTITGGLYGDSLILPYKGNENKLGEEVEP